MRRREHVDHPFLFLRHRNHLFIIPLVIVFALALLPSTVICCLGRLRCFTLRGGPLPCIVRLRLWRTTSFFWRRLLWWLLVFVFWRRLLGFLLLRRWIVPDLDRVCLPLALLLRRRFAWFEDLDVAIVVIDRSCLLALLLLFLLLLCLLFIFRGLGLGFRYGWRAVLLFFLS